MNKKYLLALGVSTILALSGCGQNTSSIVNSSSSNNSSFTSSESLESSDSHSSSLSSSSSIPDVQDEEYVILIKESIGVTITPSKDKAKAGEKIYVTVSVDSGYELVGLYMNNTKLEAVDTNKFEFTMPYNSVVLKAELTITGEVVVDGSIAFPLTLDPETGIYVARNIELREKAYLSYKVGGKKVSVIAMDDTKCFADLSLHYSSTVYPDAEFELAGNAKYDFYYDPSNFSVPCYIIRTEVLNAPTSVVGFQSLFSGTIKSEPTTWPLNVNKVTYQETVSGNEYEWNMYDNSSVAIAKNINGSDALVYKSIDGDTYTVVDSYIEGSAGYGDTTKKEDSKKTAGKYQIVNDIVDGYSKYQVTSAEAAFDVKHYSHDMESLDFDIHYGYRTGFDSNWNTSLVSKNVEVTSTNNADGGFTINIESRKTIDDARDTTIPESSKVKLHYEYRISMTFDKAGAPLNGSYLETRYDTKAYDFVNDTFLDGFEESGKIAKNMSFTYEYGANKTGKPSTEISPYFVKRMDNLTIHNKDSQVEGNGLVQYDLVSDYLSFDPYPATALDVWQYGVVSSSDISIVGPRSNREPTIFKAVGIGDVELTVGNHTTNDVTEKVNVSIVNNYLIRNFYLVAYQGYWDEDITSSSSINVNSGCVKRAKVNASATSASGGAVTLYIPTEFRVTSQDENLLKVKREGANVVVFDASSASVTTDTTVKVTVDCDNWDTSWGSNRPVVWSVVIKPYSKPVNSILTTWSDVSSYPSDPLTVVLKQYVEGDNSTLSTLSCDGNVYQFKFIYDENSGTMEAKVLGSLDYIKIIYDFTADQIGVFAATSSYAGATEESEGITRNEICGSGYYDEESGDYVVDTYYFLDRQ